MLKWGIHTSPLLLCTQMTDKKRILEHIAIIMDGNGRWAKLKGLPKIAGHRAGVAVVEEMIKGCLELGVKVLSLYAFSTENWQRPKREVGILMALLGQYLKRYLPKLQKNKIRLLVSGERNRLPLPVRREIKKAIDRTKDNRNLTLNLAINYGGREEILQATRAIAGQVKAGALEVNQIDQKAFATHLYTKGLVDPDLLIRTSGEKRVSNFFLWQTCYSEFYFSPKFWPDFKKQDLLEAVLDYQKRERRFGK